MREPPEADTRDANGALVGSDELTTRHVCGRLLGLVVALLLIFGCSIDSAGLSVAIMVIAVISCGFLAAWHGDRFWKGLVNFLVGRWWL